MLKEGNESPILKIQSFLKSERGKNSIEDWPAVISI